MFAPENPGPPDESPSYGKDLLLLGLVFGLLYFLGLGRAALMNPDEGRYAEIPREILATADWVTPRLDGVAYFEKPPLGYWVTAACQAVLGPGEGASRAMPALFGVLGVLVAYAAVRRLHGRREAVGSAVVLGSSVLYFAMARLLILDLAVAVLMSATLFAFLAGVYEAPGGLRRAFFYALYASSALATLTKGLIGFLVTGAVMFLWLLIFNQWKRLRPLYLPTGSLLFLAIAAPWHVLVARRNPTWLHFYVVDQQWLRFTTTEHSRWGPWWYFIPVVVVGLFPWIGFLGPAVAQPLRAGWARRGEHLKAWFYLTWAAFVFLFFSKSQSKLIPYIMPVFAPLAVLIGSWLARCWDDEPLVLVQARGRARAGFTVFAFLCGLLGFAAVTAVLKTGLLKEPGMAQAVRPTGLAMGAILLLGGVTATWAERAWSTRAGLVTLLATTLGFYLVIPLATPYIKPGTRDLALEVKARAGPDDLIFHYHGFFHDFLYYSGRAVGTVEFHGDEVELQNDPAAVASGRFTDEAHFRALWDGPRRVWVVAKKDTTGALFSDPSFHYHLIEERSGYTLFSNRI